MTERLITIFNAVYETEGFDGVIDEVKDRLKYGTVTEMNGLVRISTGGWSDDEYLLECLTDLLCRFHIHFYGWTRGGAHYFCEDRHANVEMVRVKE